MSAALPVLVDQDFQIGQQFGYVLDFIEDDRLLLVGVQKSTGIAGSEGAGQRVVEGDIGKAVAELFLQEGRFPRLARPGHQHGGKLAQGGLQGGEQLAAQVHG